MRLRRTRGTRRARPRRRMPRKIRRQRRGRSAFTSIKVSYSTYLTMSSIGGRLAASATSNIHIQNIMSNLITSTPNVTNFIAAYEFVALKSARVSFTNTGIANFSNSTANSMYPATQAAMFYDPYNNVAGLGGYPALTLSKLPGAVSCLGRGRIVKYMSARAICKNLGMPYWQPTATSTSNYYVPSGSGIIPIITLGVNTIDGVPNSGNCTAGLLRITGTLIFKNMKQ